MQGPTFNPEHKKKKKQKSIHNNVCYYYPLHLVAYSIQLISAHLRIKSLALEVTGITGRQMLLEALEVTGNTIIFNW